ncbi:MAG: MFS transporter [Planctomycetota bacterium]
MPSTLEPSTTVETAIAADVVAAPAQPAVGLAGRYWMLVTSHGVIDIFPILFATLLWPLSDRLALTSGQVTFILMATPIFSGLLQPLFAWLTDKRDTRLCGPVGLALGAVCIGSIGFAQNFWQLIALQIVGVIGTGMYHPISTALAGQTGTRLLRNGRTQAIGIFISAGMAGHFIGAEFGPVASKAFGMESIAWLIPPSLLLAIALHVTLRRLPHRHDNHAELHASFSPGESARRWRAVAVLTAQNGLRFIVNVGLLAVMLNVWSKSKVLAEVAAGASMTETEIAENASIHTGSLVASLTVGMGIGVIATGRYIKRGQERTPLIILSLIGAAFAAALGPLGDWLFSVGGWSFWAMLPMYICTAGTALGFFATFPIATSFAQRLQPGHTGLVTSLMMGVGWGISSLCVPLAFLFFGLVGAKDAPMLSPMRINMGFYGFAALMVLAGMLTLAIPRDLFARVADDH